MAKINREELLRAIEIVMPAVTKKEVVAQSNLLGVRSGSLVTYNDEISFCHAFPALELDEVALDGPLLHGHLSRLGADELDVIVSDDQVKVRAGRSTASFKTARLEMPLAEIEAGDEEVPLPEGFRDQLRLAAEVCSSDTSRPVLTCVSVAGDWIEGSDGYRLLRLRCAGVPEFLIPANSAVRVADCEVVRMLVGQQNEWVHFSTDAGTTISCRTYAAHYPDLSDRYELGDAREFELPPALGEVVERTAVFSQRSKRIDEQVDVELRPSQVVVRAQHENGAVEERVRWSCEDVSATFSIHPDFFRMALRQGTRCQLDDSRIKFSGDGWNHVVALR